MDTVNTIKVTVEPTKADTLVKVEKTATSGDSVNSVEELNNKDSFSDTLKGEMENKSDSQKNDTATNDLETESGNNLPNDTETPIAVLDPYADVLQGDELLSVDKGLMQDETSIKSIPEDLIEVKAIVDTVDNQIMPEGLTNSFENKAMPEGLIDASENKELPDALLSAKDQSSTLNSIQSIFQQISYGRNQFEVVNEKIDPANLSSEIIKSIVKNSQNNGNKLGFSNESSLFQGSASHPGAESLTSANIMSSLDLSANSQQNNNLNQQFSELQMRLLNQDKVVDEKTFDITKLTQSLTETQAKPIVNEINPLNQTRSPVSELMIKTPVMDKQWSAEFNNHIAFMSKSGGGNAIIKLNPAHLGPVEASIRVVNEVATVQIAATHITTREAMDAAIPRLKEMLEEQGFSKVNVDISEKGFSQNSHKSEKSEDGTSSANDELVDEEEGDFSNKESMTVLGKSVSNGVVDYFA